MSFTIKTCYPHTGKTYTDAEYPAFLHDLSCIYQCCAVPYDSITKAITTHLHVKDPFKVTGELLSKYRCMTAYNGYTLQEITTNFLTRLLYVETKIRMEPFYFVKLAVLAGIDIPDETLCCAATLGSASDGFVWLKALFKLGPSVRVTRDGKPITDAYGNSILSFVSCVNVARLLKRIHSEGVTELVKPNGRVIKALKDLPTLKFTTL